MVLAVHWNGENEPIGGVSERRRPYVTPRSVPAQPEVSGTGGEAGTFVGLDHP